MSENKKTPPPIPPKPKKAVPAPPPMPTKEQLHLHDTATEIQKNITAARAKNNNTSKKIGASKSNVGGSYMDELSKRLAKRGRVEEGPAATSGAKAEPQKEAPKANIPKKTVAPIARGKNGIPVPPPPPPMGKDGKPVPPPPPPMIKPSTPTKISISPKPMKKSKSDSELRKEQSASMMNELKKRLSNPTLRNNKSIEESINKNKELTNSFNFKGQLKRTSNSKDSLNKNSEKNMSELDKAFSKMKNKRRDSGIDLTK